MEQMKFAFEHLDDGNERLPLSHRIRAYLSELVIQEILKPNKIILESKWRYVLSGIFDHDSDGASWPSKVDGTRLAATQGVVLLPPNSYSKEGLKHFTLILSFHRAAQSDSPTMEYADMLYEGACLLFTNYFKKVDPAQLDRVRKKIDRVYLQSLPYPAPFTDQRYEGDAETGRAVIIRPARNT